MKPTGTEHQEQAAVIDWWRLSHKLYNLPEFALFAIPNGGARNIVTASKLKAEGVRPGVPDLCLVVSRGWFHGLWIEMKVKPNKPTASQLEVMVFLNSNGYRVSVCYSAEAAIEIIKEYLQ